MTLRVLVLDDGEVPTAGLCEALRRAGADVVRILDLFEVPLLLDSNHFDVLLGHEVFLLLAREMKLSSRRCLLAARPEEWTQAQLEFIGASAVITDATEAGELLRAVGL